MMQWFVNEVRENFQKVDQRIEGLKMAKTDDDLLRRVEKLEGELRAMKARMGKNKNNKEPSDQ